MLTTQHFTTNPYTALFLVESTITPQAIFELDLAERMEYMDLVVNMTLKRNDLWPNKEAARAYFKKRLPWAMWDERSIEAYVVRLVPCDSMDVRWLTMLDKW